MLVMTAGLDPLRDEGEAFVHRAREAGALVDLVRYEHTIHGFFGRKVTSGAHGIAHAAKWFEQACGGGDEDEGEQEAQP
jgi:acetyl esterase